jgi:hypothetical protein
MPENATIFATIRQRGICRQIRKKRLHQRADPHAHLLRGEALIHLRS